MQREGKGEERRERGWEAGVKKRSKKKKERTLISPPRKLAETIIPATVIYSCTVFDYPHPPPTPLPSLALSHPHLSISFPLLLYFFIFLLGRRYVTTVEEV